MSKLHWGRMAAELQAGDLWVSSANDVEIVAVTYDPARDFSYPVGRIYASGRIVRGYGKAKKIRNWTFHPDQTLDYERA